MTSLHWDQLTRKDVTASFKEEKSVLLKEHLYITTFKGAEENFSFLQMGAETAFYDETFVKKELCTHQTTVFLQPCGVCETPSICVSALVPLTC